MTMILVILTQRRSVSAKLCTTCGVLAFLTVSVVYSFSLLLLLASSLSDEHPEKSNGAFQEL